MSPKYALIPCAAVSVLALISTSSGCTGRVRAPTAGAAPGQAGQAGQGGGPPAMGTPTGAAGATVVGAGGADGGTTTMTTPTVPFEALPIASAVTKVKAVLTGLAPTQAEITAVTNDPKALATSVDAWMKLPAYQAKMERFFADAFQQSQAQSQDWKSVIDDGIYTPGDPLLLNLRQSFAKTMTALVAAGQPFTAAATTTRYMMTTAMMTYLAYADSSLLTDVTAAGPGQLYNRFYRANQKWSWSVTSKRTVALADSGNPTSPDYLVFSIPNLAGQYGTTDNAAYCGGVDPAVFTAQSSFALGDNMAAWLYSFLLGQDFWFFDPPQGQPGSKWCEAGGTTTDAKDQSLHTSFLTDADYADWRMVTVQTASSAAPQTRFFDIAANRTSSTLTLYAPRVGYFTTPAFFSQYPTNISNQGRVTINQTMIVGLGQAFDGSDPITVQNAAGLDPVHAAGGCFACHWSLDPMRRFFRSTYTLNYSAQLAPAETSVPGSFLFDNVVDNGTTIFDLAKQIAAHPKFKTAWTKKLCEWANSNACDENDPELVRVAGVFAGHNYDWNALVHELFTSPLVTSLSPTETAGAHGTPVYITRRTQLCATLDNRLGLTDVCGLTAIQTGSGGKTVPAVAAQLPNDGYSRGQVSALYVNDPDPFYRAAVEKICALVADKVVDAPGSGAGGASLYASATATASIADLAHNLMGLDSTRDAAAIGILTDHFNAAMTAGSTATVALKSTFTLACTSPWVVSVGQ
jgi:hypothetical protein